MKWNQRWIASILLFSVAVGLLPAGYASAAAPPVMDQEQTLASGNVFVNRDYPRYQTFTPAISGNLNKVELNVFDYYASTGAIRLNIYKEGDLGTPLAAAEVASYSPGWIAIDFSGASPYLKKNTMYRMVASTENGGASAGFGWYTSPGDPYKRGSSSSPGYDFSFRTYMVADYSLSLEESEVSTAKSSLAADGASQTTVSVKLKDAQGNALTTGGAAVAITSTLGTVGTVTDMQNGTYTATLTAPTTAGTALISATVNGGAITATASVQFVPGAASVATSTVKVGSASLVADGASQTTVSVKLNDANGNALTTGGAAVAITSTLGTVGAVTDMRNGTYTATLTAPTTTGTATISATVDGSPIASTASVQFVPGAVSVANSTVKVGSASLVADGASQTTVSVELKDAQGNDLTTGGSAVAITSTLGTVGAVTDMQNGTYTATLTAPTTAGTATISATVNGAAITATASVQFVPGAASVVTSTVKVGSASLAADGASQTTVSVELKDANGNVLRSGGETVAITSTLGTVGPVTDNNDGTYTATLTAPTTPDTATISASIGGRAIAATASVEFVPGAPSTETSTIEVGTDSLTADGKSQTTVTVRLKDAQSNALRNGGETVAITSTLGTVGLVTDNNDGTYTATLTAPTTEGTATIGASIGGSELAATVKVTVYPVPTYIIEALPDLVLKELTAGYASGEQETKTVTITSKGTATLKNLSVSLSGVDGDKYFTVTQPVETTLEHAGDTTTFTVTPKAGLSAGTYTTMVTVAADNMTPVSFSVTQVVNAASPAKLSSLRVSQGILTPAFSPDSRNYTVNVGNGVTSINVTADLADPKTTMTINGKPFTSGIASTVDLNVGTNAIRIELTAPDGVTKSFYAISVKRNDYIPPYYPVTSVALSKSKITLTEGGETETLTTTVLPDYATNKQVTWRSSNPKVAQVNENGVITPLAEGTATITITTADQEKSAECQVTVLPKDNPVTGIDVSEKKVMLKPKQSLQLQVRIVYADGEAKDITTDENTKYSSSADKIATVEAGRIIAGNREGTATITIDYQGDTIEIPVTVSKLEVQELTTPAESVQMDLNENMQLRVTALLSNGKRKDVTNSAIWSSDNEKSVTVSKKGKITSVGAGTATITAIYGGKSVTIEVEVFGQKVKKLTPSENKVVLGKGNEQQIGLTAVFMDGSEKIVTEEAEWSTTNRKTATVKNGLITGISAGKATIKAKYRGKTITISVTVTK